MLTAGRRTCHSLVLLLVCLCAAGMMFAQEPETALKDLVTSGQVTLRGQSRQYVVRHLPTSSFPDLPEHVATELNQRGCLIPQSYQARRPENVVQGSFQRVGSSDWAVLCSVKGTVSLLVFFDGAARVHVLATAPETHRLQVHDSSGVLGFNWGIDAASPQAVHDAQNGVSPRSRPPDHDSVSDSVVDRKTIYHHFADGAWSLVDMPD